MARWIVLAIPVDGVADATGDARTVTELEGTAAEAAEALVHAVRTFDHSFRKARRREIFQCSERSYYVRLHGLMTTTGHLLQLAERVHDSASPGQPGGATG
ncbi:hypothetical protein [Streptomyces sp. BV129]|uniref:hypothetical protein n=1 Tax=Streptomyces sp. BV129 TaxID=2849671 RepID=UPI001C2EEBE1|nr:hypothetical protein [Streptomyces sp. BV129]MBV1944817.1 hypothetical protein [Streptomyces sp. BV129]